MIIIRAGERLGSASAEVGGVRYEAPGPGQKAAIEIVQQMALAAVPDGPVRIWLDAEAYVSYRSLHELARMKRLPR
jgi:hypothetical protein